MAAVAGSKGRIQSCPNTTLNTRSFQAAIAHDVLRGALSPREAAERIVSEATLREVGIDTNMMCNLRCAYCYLDDRPVEKARIPPDEWFGLLSPFAERGCKLFAFIGKEPLLDETAIGLLELLDRQRAPGRNFRTGMVTNGTLLHRFLNRIEDAGLSYLDVSLDGLPGVNDLWRGKGAGHRALRNLKSLLARQPQFDMFVSCVLHQGNLNHLATFVPTLFDMGLTGFFTSPVLRFTRNGMIDEWSIGPAELHEVIETLRLVAADVCSSTGEHQIVLDLPYRYAWWLLASGWVEPERILDDRFEVPYLQPDESVPFFIKMNFISFSFYRAVRITHDGVIVANLDLAAHPDYDKGQVHASGVCSRDDETAITFHTSFLQQHRVIGEYPERLFDRDVGSQLSWGVSAA